MNCERCSAIVGSEFTQLAAVSAPQVSHSDRMAMDCWMTIAGDDRWSICQRLQALGCDCICVMGEPLQLRVRSPQDLIQAWMVLRHRSLDFSDRRSSLVANLEACWRLSSLH